MANTFTQINIQLIFAVQGRENILAKSFRENLFRYIFGILKESKQFPLAVNGYLDHVHTFFELNPKSSVSDIARIVKANSSKWINENKLIRSKFYWQKGFGAFSYSLSKRRDVINYIMNQEEHHRKKTFREEYIGFLEVFNVKYDKRYLFEWVDLDL